MLFLRIVWAVLGLAAVWAILHLDLLLAPFGIGQLWYLSIVKLAIFLVGGIAYVYVPYQIATREAEGINVIANKDGLGLPSTSLLGMGAPRWLGWDEVKQLEAKQTLFGAPYLEIGLKNGESHRLKVKSIHKEDLEQLLLSLEVWAEQAVWSPKLIEYRDDLSNSNRGLTGLSYTQMWEEELGRRFNSTTFVPLQPGRTLRGGSLKIVRQLAFGGFSAVYLAEDNRAGTVVLKESVYVLDENDPVKRKAAELFQREARLLARLQHPQIARVLDHFTENARDYLVIEHIEGENLRQLVKRLGKQQEAKVIGWAKQLINILKYLHIQEIPIIHRDFTPDNLILRNDGSLVLIDFGAANQFLGSATGTLLGKPAYMAPEQVKGKATPESDLYAFGCTLYFLLVGHDPETLSVAHPRTEVPVISKDLDGLIANLTAPEVSERPTANQILAELEKFSQSSKMESHMR
jgi:hypothetical protein